MRNVARGLFFYRSTIAPPFLGSLDYEVHLQLLLSAARCPRARSQRNIGNIITVSFIKCYMLNNDVFVFLLALSLYFF